MKVNVWESEHSVAFNPSILVRNPAHMGIPAMHVDGIRVSNATAEEWVKVHLELVEFGPALGAQALEALKSLRWSVAHRRVFVRDPAEESVWEPLGSRALDRMVTDVVIAARECDAAVRRSFA